MAERFSTGTFGRQIACRTADRGLRTPSGSATEHSAADTGIGDEGLQYDTSPPLRSGRQPGAGGEDPVWGVDVRDVDRIVVITGATGKLGPTVAATFAAAGDRIAALGRRADALETLVEGLPGGSGRHLALAVDLRDADRAVAASAVVRERMGPPTVLLHVVGSYRGEAGIAEAPLAEWAAMLDVNLWSTVHAVRAFLPDIRAAEHGRLVTVSTPFAASPNATGGAYSASKAAVEALTLSVAKELAGTSATANVILVRTIGDAKPHHTRPAEIAAALLWLTSPDAGIVNGQRIPLVGRG